MFKVNKKHKNDVKDEVLVFLLLTLKIFHTFASNASLVDFQQANVSWNSCFVSKFCFTSADTREFM